LTHHIHPEFGYLWPMPRFRRDLRVGCFAFAMGVGLGAIVVVGFSAYERETRTASTPDAEGALALGSETAFEPQSGPSFQTLRLRERGAGPVQNAPRDAKPCDNADRRRHCGSQALREARAPAADNGPLIARVPLGRSAAPIEENSKRAHSDVPEASKLAESPHITRPSSDVSPPPGVADAAQNPPRPPPLLRKKPLPAIADQKKIGAAQNRDAGAKQAAVAAQTGENASRELAQAYARDSSHRRTVFWDWSR